MSAGFDPGTFHAELLDPAEAYAPFGKAGPTMNAHELHQLRQAMAAPPGVQYGAGAPQIAQLVAALLASRTGART